MRQLLQVVLFAISRELYDGAVVKVKENSRPSRKRG